MSATGPRSRELPDRFIVERGRIAFQARVGVTGHRSLAHQEDPARIVGSRLSEILACCQGSEATPVVLTILSALADGADRLVVEAARTLAKATGIQFRLQAVLPLAVEDYREDFDPHTSRPAFDELLAGADVRVQMPAAGDRDEAYESAGRYIVDHSDVMVAVWDGARSGGRGGTAEIVSYAREQGVPVLVVPASRAGEQPHLAAEAAEDDNLPAKLESMSEAFARVDEYNRRSVASGDLSHRLEVEQERLRDALDGTSIHSSSSDAPTH